MKNITFASLIVFMHISICSLFAGVVTLTSGSSTGYTMTSGNTYVAVASPKLSGKISFE